MGGCGKVFRCFGCAFGTRCFGKRERVGCSALVLSLFLPIHRNTERAAQPKHRAEGTYQSNPESGMMVSGEEFG